ncbi:OLC1v1031597C1 [Oldenlandia corymbosa var. corymbosa]|uniref:OLC1v1031597C1 n=1 Tax=Oldenlandia corymbosa var. corymbosa TaxID=529605 RepID=A0AAV1CLQ5_OLDCO|nr:OLC1v1031597C1 [Oldenlandia corymbosa var. corymbosa]
MAEPPVLPDELHGEILRRVSVKSLMRFKCVSKTWLPTLLDPSFTKTYGGGSRVNSYKLLSVGHKYQILTVEKDSTWRDIDPPPVDINHREGVNYSEGVLYWLTSWDRNEMVTFDLVQEKFQSIPLPERNVSYQLVNSGPVAVMSEAYPGNRWSVIYYNSNNNNNNNRRISPKGAWSDDEVMYDLSSQEETGLFPEGLFPDGKMLLYSSQGHSYLFDPIQRETKEIGTASEEFRNIRNWTGGSVISGNPSTLSMVEPVLPDELHWEILRWLPAKSLMRLKCVSKIWRSTIMDRSFRKAYCGGSRGLLMHKKSLFYLFRLDDIEEENDDGPNTCQVSHYSTVKHGCDHEMQATGVVNGYLDGSDRKNYYLGFDPDIKLYKLLFIKRFRIASNLLHTKCQILTIGAASSWRDISPPSVEINSASGYSEGVLYWLGRDHVVAFDLIQEKFRSIPLHKAGLRCFLLNFGNMAVMSIWDANDKRLIARYNNIRGHSGESLVGEGAWDKKVQFILPSQEFNLFPGGILPNGKVLMFPYDKSPFDQLPASFYLFDPIKRETKEIVIEVDPSVASELLGDGSKRRALLLRGSYYEENINSLRCLTSAS